MKGVDPAEVNYLIPKLRCKICKYVWFARKAGKILNCPSCRSTDWNAGKVCYVVIPTITCPKCEHEWSPRYAKIHECPACKKRLINKGVKK